MSWNSVLKELSIRYSRDADSLPVWKGRRMAVIGGRGRQRLREA